MQVHYSESPDDTKLVPKHSDYYRNPMPSWVSELNCHIHLEVKQKELALLKYRNDFSKVEAI
jgi:UV DNA damage repair endonuclease